MTLNQFTTNALIIREQQIGESDRVVTMLSSDYGIIKAYATGAKTIKSKKGAATSLLAYSSITVSQKNDTYRIIEASPLKIFFKAGEDIEILSLAQYFCELCDRYVPRRENCNDILRLTLNTLYFLSEKKRNIHLLKGIFELRLLSLVGYMPDLVACKSCVKYEDDIMYFDTYEGVLFCPNCISYSKDFAVINKTLLTTLRHIIYVDLERLFAFSIPDEAALALSKITEKYLLNKTEHTFQTLNFFNSLF